MSGASVVLVVSHDPDDELRMVAAVRVAVPLAATTGEVHARVADANPAVTPLSAFIPSARTSTKEGKLTA
jgi:hypothetical protein